MAKEGLEGDAGKYSVDIETFYKLIFQFFSTQRIIIKRNVVLDLKNGFF